MADDGITSSRDLELGLQNVAEELEPATATSSLGEDLELGLQNVAEELEPATATSSLTREDLELGLQNVAEELEPATATATSSLNREDLELGQNVADKLEPSRSGDPSIADLDDNNISPDHIPSPSHNEQTDTRVDDSYMERMTIEELKIVNKDGNTALHVAVYENKFDYFQLLVKRMTTKELKIQNKDGDTALHIAVDKNKFDYFQLLVEHMTIEELKIQNSKGNTALHIAISKKKIDYFQQLVERMTLKELKIQNKDGDTALHIALDKNKIDCFQLLVEHMTIEELKIQNNKGNTALHIAVHKSKIEYFEVLVPHLTPEELKIQNKDGDTALHIAVHKSKIEYFERLVPRMTPEQLKIQNNNGDTALHIAAQPNKIHFATQLIERMTPKDLQIHNNNGDTAFRIALAYDNINFLLLLVKVERMSTKDLAIHNNNGDTALHIAARLNKIDLAQQLIERMTLKDQQIQNNDGDTALHVAVRNNNIEFLLLLVKAKRMTIEDLQMQNKAGDTALHLAKGLNKINLEQIFFMTISYNIYDVADKLFDMYPDALAIARDQDKEKLTALHMLAQKEEYVKQMEKDELFKKLWTQVRQLGDVEKMLDLISNPSPVLFDAVESGNTDVVKWALDKNPEVLDEIKYSTKGQNLLHLAALYRQKSIFDFILLKIKTEDLSKVDDDGNNALHFAAQYKSKSPAELRPKIEMEREFKWFKAAGKKLPPELRKKKNKGGKTPTDIFNADHSEVCKQVKDAAKGISDSGMIVATLIVSVAFAAAVSTPGEKTNNWFIVFILADAVALLASATSIICFLSIFTSARSNESEYIISTQPILDIGLLLVLISIGAMIVAFVAASLLIFEHRSKWAAYAVTSLCVCPISMFLMLQISSRSDDFVFDSKVFEYMSQLHDWLHKRHTS